MPHSEQMVFIDHEITMEEREHRLHITRLMKRVRKTSIKLCSAYIAVMKKTKCYIQRSSGNRLKSRLYHNLEIIIDTYIIIKTSIEKKLRDAHREEFRISLVAKNNEKEIAQKLANWDVNWLIAHGLPTTVANNPESKRMLLISGVRRYNQTGWRKYSRFKRHLGMTIEFDKYIKDIIEQYKSIIENSQVYI